MDPGQRPQRYSDLMAEQPGHWWRKTRCGLSIRSKATTHLLDVGAGARARFCAMRSGCAYAEAWQLTLFDLPELSIPAAQAAGLRARAMTVRSGSRCARGSFIADTIPLASKADCHLALFRVLYDHCGRNRSPSIADRMPVMRFAGAAGGCSSANPCRGGTDRTGAGDAYFAVYTRWRWRPAAPAASAEIVGCSCEEAGFSRWSRPPSRPGPL